MELPAPVLLTAMSYWILVVVPRSNVPPFSGDKFNILFSGIVIFVKYSGVKAFVTSSSLLASVWSLLPIYKSAFVD